MESARAMLKRKFEFSWNDAKAMSKPVNTPTYVFEDITSRTPTKTNHTHKMYIKETDERRADQAGKTKTENEIIRESRMLNP
jgi:hypothetical protein